MGAYSSYPDFLLADEWRGEQFSMFREEMWPILLVRLPANTASTTKQHWQRT